MQIEVCAFAGLTSGVKLSKSFRDKKFSSCFLLTHYEINAYRYTGHDTLHGQAQVVLTVALITDRRFCTATFESRDVMEDVVKDFKPYWNGEDIFHSLASYKLTGWFRMVRHRQLLCLACIWCSKLLIQMSYRAD